jgi:hypothetical protein
MAAAHVTGTAALVWTQYPAWNNVQVRNRLRATAVDLGSYGHDSQFGYGRVNAAMAAAPPTGSPSWATIVGPTAMKPGNTCYWYFSTNVSDPNIEWRVNGTVLGTSPGLFYSSSENFTLELVLWNTSTGQGANDTHDVSVSWSNSDCADQ